MQNILLVEDDPQSARLINLHFATAQYSLTCCATGEEALNNIKKETETNHHITPLCHSDI